MSKIISLNKFTQKVTLLKDGVLPSEIEKLSKVKNMVVVHSGRFHIDEVLALIVYAGAHPTRDIQVLRSRRKSDEFHPSTTFIDVGFTYDGRHHFDHHQKGFTLTGTASVKRSSAGLIWKTFGHEYISHLTELNDDQNQMLWYLIDFHFIQSIDRTDNYGVKDRGHISSIFSDFQLERGDVNTEFADAYDWLNDVFSRRIRKYCEIVTEYDTVKAVRSGDVLTVNKSIHPLLMDYMLGDYIGVKYLMWPERGAWTLRATEDKYNLKVGLGTEGKYGCIFIHANGFMAKARGKENLVNLVATNRRKSIDEVSDEMVDEFLEVCDLEDPIHGFVHRYAAKLWIYDSGYCVVDAIRDFHERRLSDIEDVDPNKLKRILNSATVWCHDADVAKLYLAWYKANLDILLDEVSRARTAAAPSGCHST